jgi:hypothetical protein
MTVKTAKVQTQHRWPPAMYAPEIATARWQSSSVTQKSWAGAYWPNMPERFRYDPMVKRLLLALL